jgi:general secretion pathway protein H
VAQRGLTLIEILIVLALMGLMLTAAGLSMGTAGQAEIVRATNQVASTMRFAFDKARVSGTHLRIKINFAERSFTLQAAGEAMYLPATDRDGEIVVRDEDDVEEQKDRDERAAERYNRSLSGQLMQQVQSGTAAGATPGPEDPGYNPYAVEAKAVPRRTPPLFDAFENEGGLKGLAEPVIFPEEVEILAVRTESDPEPVTEGEAFLYFFPQGRTQMAYIHMRDKDGDEESAYTITIQPLTGKVEVHDGLVKAEFPADLLKGRDDLGKTKQRRSF